MLLRLKGIGQISSDQLPPAEQIAAGGPDFGRALSSGLIAGDRGIAASAELAVLPNISKQARAYASNYGKKRPSIWGATVLKAPYPELTDVWRFFLTARVRLGE